jgi:hypothetical protein
MPSKPTIIAAGTLLFPQTKSVSQQNGLNWAVARFAEQDRSRVSQHSDNKTLIVILDRLIDPQDESDRSIETFVQ